MLGAFSSVSDRLFHIPITKAAAPIHGRQFIDFVLVSEQPIELKKMVIFRILRILHWPTVGGDPHDLFANLLHVAE